MKTEEEKNQTILKVLFEKEICFAVNVSIRTLKIKSVEENSRAYFIIIHESDLNDIVINGKTSEHSKEINGFIFYRTDEYPDVFDRYLSDDDIVEFKEHMSKFVKIKHNKFGRVYELKNNSFKKLYDVIKNKLVANN